MEITQLPLGLMRIKTTFHQDNRGQVAELWKQNKMPDIKFVQENISISHYGVLRGIHFQRKYPQGKLISVLSGVICDVAVDIRDKSPTFGSYHQEILDSNNANMLWIPTGFAHGFSVLSETAVVLYRLTDYYHPDDQGCIKWNDPDLNINWGIKNPILSDKDKNGIYLRDYQV